MGSVIGIANDPGWAAKIASLIAKLGNANALDLIAAEIAADTNQKVQPVLTKVSDAGPAFIVVQAAQQTWILIGGALTPALLAQTAAGYPGPLVQLGGDEATRHPFFESCATRVLDVYGTDTTQSKGGLYIAGHSLGGCVATAVAERLRASLADVSQFELATFGSPRYSTRTNCARLNNARIGRYMNAADPIPLFYPHGSEWLPGLFLNTTFQISRVNRFTHTQGGLLIKADASIRAAEYPPLIDVAWGSSMLAWLTSNMVEYGANAHSIDSYVQALNAADLARAQPTDRPKPSEVIPPEEGNSRTAETRLSFAVEQHLAAVEHEQHVHPLAIPRAHEVTFSRSGRVHIVSWQGHVIALTNRRRSAHSLAKNLNGMLAHLLVQGMLDPEALTQALAAFLAAASAGTSGITPTLPTTLPTALNG